MSEARVKELEAECSRLRGEVDKARALANQIADTRAKVSEHELEDQKAARLIREAEANAAHLAGRLVTSDFHLEEALAERDAALARVEALTTALREILDRQHYLNSDEIDRINKLARSALEPPKPTTREGERSQ